MSGGDDGTGRGMRRGRGAAFVSVRSHLNMFALVIVDGRNRPSHGSLPVEALASDREHLSTEQRTAAQMQAHRRSLDNPLLRLKRTSDDDPKRSAWAFWTVVQWGEVRSARGEEREAAPAWEFGATRCWAR